jgi:transcriptional regulator of acetoin/glycerol metabolism
MERQLILEALRLTSGCVPDAARQLGLSPATLYRKVKKFGIGRAWPSAEHCQ